MNQKMAEKIYEGSLLISRLALMNVLWGIFVLLGAGIFGFLPATVTLYTIFRKQRKQENFKWMRVAWVTYWKNFKKLFGLSFALAIILLSLYLSWLTLGQKHFLLSGVIIGIILYLVFLVVPYFSVNEAHFDLPVIAQIKNSLLLPFFWGWTSLKVLLPFLGMGLLGYMVPGLLIFFGLSVPIYLSCYTILARWDKQLASLKNGEGE